MNNQPLTITEKLILALVLILANLRALMFVFLFPDTSTFWGPAWMEILLWLAAGCSVCLFLIQRHANDIYFRYWRRNWLLALFLALALASILWSVSRINSVFRVLELLFATGIAAYYGLRLRPAQWLDVLFWFGAGLFILSTALVYGAPNTGTMYWAPFHGAWRGVYWHRNHLASITALLSAVYLIRALLAWQSRSEKGVLDILLYAVSLIVLYFAKSATGYILFLVLNFLVACVWLWLKIHHRLQRWHYLLFLAGGVFAAAVILSNLGFIFGLFHRTTTLTGRVPLWQRLLEVVAGRPWLGHGFGAVWMLDPFREQMKQLAGWGSQPLIADNGFLDILLHLGVIGLMVFVLLLLWTTFQTARYAATQKNLAAFFPLLVMVYVFAANLTFSLFAETEVFVWFLIVAVLFMTSGNKHREGWNPAHAC